MRDPESPDEEEQTTHGQNNGSQHHTDVAAATERTALLAVTHSNSDNQVTTIPSQRRRLFTGTGNGEQEVTEERVDDDEEGGIISKSPFLSGVTVGKFWVIFVSMLACHFVGTFDSTIMVSSHPVITSYFHSSNSASWMSTAFLLTSTSFQPLFGRLSDILGRKPPFLFTLSVFLIATIWCALAQSMISFIIARAVCGLGAGGMLAMGAIITSDLVPIEIRGVYQSYINISYGLGSALGAALGGVIADNLGWRWEFGVQVPFIAIGLIVTSITIPKDLGLAEGVKQQGLVEAMKVFDYQGSILLTTSITFLILGLNLGGNILPWSHPFIISSMITFGISSALFVCVEYRALFPIMPVKLLTHDPRASLIISNAIGAIIMNAVIFNAPLYFQAVLLDSATNSGLRILVISIASSTVGTATGFIITWTRRLKPPLVAGTVLYFIGTCALVAMRRGMPTWAYLFILVPSSMGQGFMFPATFMSVLAVSEQVEQAVVTSTLLLWRSTGMVLGVAASSFVLQNALVLYLNQMVTGPDKEKVILEVRKSVQAIADLEPHYREQVINSYAEALRATFIMAAVLSAITILITVRMKLPRLGPRK